MIAEFLSDHACTPRTHEAACIRPSKSAMEIKSVSPSNINISRRCKLIVLFALNILIVLILVPIYGRLLFAVAWHHEQSAPPPSATAVTAGQYLHLNHQQKEQISIRRKSPPATLIGHYEIPYIGQDKFNEKYSVMYKGLLPSLKRESPDISCGNYPDFFDFFRLPKTERSRFYEDKIIYDLFKELPISKNKHNYNIHASKLPTTGTYVELGAFDGKDESNTIFFDKCLGWDGLLIEGQSQSYEKVIANRPNAVKLSFSPTCKNANETVSFYDYPLSNNGVQDLAKSYVGKTTIEIPCGPLTPVLQDLFGPDGKITFFSLDVEGAELLVLETLDFDAVYIEVIMVEVQNAHCPDANCESVHKIRRHMAMTRKYSLFVDFLEASDVYIRWGTDAWSRAKAIEKQRKEDMERGILEHNNIKLLAQDV